MGHRQGVQDPSPGSPPARESTGIRTIDQIAADHPGEWVLIADYETDEALEVLSGRVLSHHVDRDALMRSLQELRPVDFAIYRFGPTPSDLEFML